LQRIKNKYL